MNDSPPPGGQGAPTPGSLVAIWAKGAKGQPMIPQDHGELIAGEGLAGSAPARGLRQITVLSREAWRRAANEAGWPDADPALRRANLLVAGVDLEESRGRTLAVGDARIRIHGETTPCERMDAEALPLREALGPEWRGGAFGQILVGGTIRPGDPVAWSD